MSKDLSKFSLWDLFRGEVESHSKTLNDGLLALEESLGDVERIKPLMRAAHSIKGAARVVQHPLAVEVAHGMEDRLVAAQSGTRPLTADDVQSLLDGVDLLGRLAPVNEGDKASSIEAGRADADRLLARLSGAAPPVAPAAVAGPGTAPPPVAAPTPVPAPAAAPVAITAPASAPPPAAVKPPEPPPPSSGPRQSQEGDADRSFRMTAQTVTRLMGLAGEAVIATRWLEPFAAELQRGKQQLAAVSQALDHLEIVLEREGISEEVAEAINFVQQGLERSRGGIGERIVALEQFSLRQDALSDRLYREVLATRMRPFGDLVEGFPRLVRDVARQLGKKVRLEIQGASTNVDRDVAALLEAPLNHVVRNALDHGVERPEDRVRVGKPETATVRMRAFHRAGMLVVEVTDDGRGVDLEVLRRKIVEKKLADEAMVARLAEAELLEFLFLPGFSTAPTVTDISGRGVGLDVVLDTMKKTGGRSRLTNHPGAGLSVTFELPVSLSVLRALIVHIAGEPYALPLTRVERVLVAPRGDVRVIEGRQYLSTLVFDGNDAGPAGAAPGEGGDEGMVRRHVGLATARQVLGIEEPPPPSSQVSVVVIRDRDALYGLVVDRIAGEESVAVRPLDPRLGKVPDVSAAALAFDGTPLLVLDPDDMVRSIDQILSGGRLSRIEHGGSDAPTRRKRVLVVDDSITVREVERQVLEARGYDVEVAVDGMDGWNALRTGTYDLVVSDVDMPRLDGIGLVTRIRADARHGQVPVIIVSYKDREDDRLRGLDAGASYYLPKSAFQDDTFLRAVDELIGGPEA